MIALGHTATGVIIGVTSYKLLGQQNLIEGLAITSAVSIVSHYFTDFLPHGHYFMPQYFKKYVVPVIILDVLLPVLVFLGIMYFKSGLDQKFFYVFFSIGGAQLPDVIDGLVYTKKLKAEGLLKAENDLHQKIHWHGRDSKTLLLGLRDLWQLLLILIALFLVFFNV